MQKYVAELVGTFWLVLGGCGSAVLAAGFPEVGIGLLGVSLAFGLTVLTMAYAIGHISGCHLNPAVSIGLWAGGRFEASDLAGYIIAQVLGGILAGGVLYLIASGASGFDLAGGFASRGTSVDTLVSIEHAIGSAGSDTILGDGLDCGKKMAATGRKSGRPRDFFASSGNNPAHPQDCRRTGQV